MAKQMIDSWIMASSADIRRTADFYKKIGLTPSVRRPFYLEYQLPGGTAIGFHLRSGRSGRTAKGGKGTGSRRGWGLMLRVRRLEGYTSALKRKRLRPSTIVQAPGGAYVSHLYDPDGNRITLLQMA